MAKRSNHVIPAKNGWKVKKSGSTKASKTFKTKKEARAFGIKLSKKEETELYIHKRNGTIQNRNSYGNDPHPLTASSPNSKKSSSYRL